MGLTVPALKYLIQLRASNLLNGPLLTLGNQDVYATAADVRRLLAAAALPACEAAEEPSASYLLPGVNRQASGYIDGRAFFALLGIAADDYFDVDTFAFDGPRILADLQQPMAAEYQDRFNFILDGGTLEHIFDVRAVLANLVTMTTVGGCILHMAPAAGFVNHGFYQFSPTLFADFYEQNGFEVVESYVAETRGGGQRFHRYDQAIDYTGVFLNPFHRLTNVFLVRKECAVDGIVNPVQSYYLKVNAGQRAVEADFRRTSFDRLVERIRWLLPLTMHSRFLTAWQLLKQLTWRKPRFDLRSNARHTADVAARTRRRG